MPRYHDEDSERSLIGAAFVDASVLDRVGLPPDTFFSPRNQLIWRLLLELHADNQPLDAILVAERANTPQVTLADLAAYTVAGVPSIAEHHAAVVRKHATTREVLRAAAHITELHKRGEAEGDELLDAAMAAISAINVGKQSDALTIGQVVKERFAQLDQMLKARENGEEPITGVPTGLPSLDRAIAGVQPGIVTIVAARPGMGKSAFAMQVADAASANGHGVHVFSLEDTRAAYADRSLSTGARVPTTRIRTARLERGDMLAINRRAADLCGRKKWRYQDVGGMSAEAVVRDVRRIRKDNDTRLVIIDYIQLLDKPRRYQNENYAMDHIIKVLAAAAKADNLAYLVLCQLNRDCEKREDKRPRASDLRDSGSLEQVAKCVLGLYRGSVYGPPRSGIDYNDDDPNDRRPSDEEWEQRLEIVICKQNHGPPGTVVCRWDGPCTRIYE